jgi:hypothetical protein
VGDVCRPPLELDTMIIVVKLVQIICDSELRLLKYETVKIYETLMTLVLASYKVVFRPSVSW